MYVCVLVFVSWVYECIEFKDNVWAKGPLQNAYNDGKLTEDQYEYLTHEKPKGVYGPTDIINNDMA